MIALARAARRLEEEHRLHRQHVGADQRLQHVEDPRVQEEALVDLQLAVRSMWMRSSRRSASRGGLLDRARVVADDLRSARR